METPTEEEVKQWQQNPVTRYVIEVLKKARLGAMETAVEAAGIDSAARVALLDRAAGIKLAIMACSIDVEDE